MSGRVVRGRRERWVGVVLAGVASWMLAGCSLDCGDPTPDAPTLEATLPGQVVAFEQDRFGDIVAVVVDPKSGKASLLRYDPGFAVTQVLDTATDAVPDGGGLLALGEQVIVWSAKGSGPWQPGHAGVPRWVPRDPSVGAPHELDGRWLGITQIDVGAGQFVWTRHNHGDAYAVPDQPAVAPPLPVTIDRLEFPSGIAATAHGIYIIDRLAAVMLRYTEAGAKGEVVAQWAGDNTMRLAHDDATLAFRNHARGTIVTMALPDGELVELPQQGVESWGPIAVGPDAIFSAPFTEDPGRKVLAWPRDGGAAASMGAVGEGCTPVVVPDRFGFEVFFSDCSGRIWRHLQPGQAYGCE